MRTLIFIFSLLMCSSCARDKYKLDELTKSSWQISDKQLTISLSLQKEELINFSNKIISFIILDEANKTIRELKLSNDYSMIKKFGLYQFSYAWNLDKSTLNKIVSIQKKVLK